MKIHFHGAVGDVTGAAFQLTTHHASVLVDCGLYQGSRQTVAKNRQIPTLARRRVDAVVVSHALFGERVPVILSPSGGRTR